MGIIILFFIIMLHCIPELVSLVMICGMLNGEKRKNKIIIVFLSTGLMNGLAYLLVHRYLLVRWNFLKTVREVLELSITYRYIEYLSFSLLICYFVAIIVIVIATFILRNKVSSRLKCFSYLSFIGVGIITYALYQGSQNGLKQLVINEVCTDNEFVAVNDIGEVADYIEIYNDGFMNNSLEGIYISDDVNDLKKLPITIAVIAPKGYVVIPLGNESISLSRLGGETIYLSDEKGDILNQVTTCQLDYDQAYARIEDAGNDWDVVSCTPGSTNVVAEAVSDVYVNAPKLSHASGFYLEEFVLSMISGAGTEVYYTLDGSTPDKDTAIRYESPVVISNASDNANVLSACEEFSANEYYIPDYLVDKGTVVKARAYDSAGNYSDVTTAVFFVDNEENVLNNRYTGLEIPVLSLIADPDDLIGYENGILVLGKKFDEYVESFQGETIPIDNLIDYIVEANFNQKGKGWEREAQLSFFYNGELLLEQKVGIRRRGKSSSMGAQKGFNIYARDEYSDTSFLDYDIFQSGSCADRVTLKYSKCLLKDGFIMDLVKDRAFIPLYYSPVSFFLNGEYWGTYMMMERYEESFFKNYYGIDNVTIFCNGSITAGNTQEDLNQILEWAATHDMSEAANYEIMEDAVDLQSLIDYYCTRIYIDDIDSTETFNMVAWKPEYDENNIYADGKWHWAIYDIDASLVDFTRNNLTEQIRENRDAFLNHQLIKSLLQNEEFEKRFIVSFTDMMNFNFASDIVLPLYEEKVSAWYDALQYNSLRFYGTDISESQFEEEKEFYRKRSEYVLKYLRETFELQEPVNMSIAAKEGTSEIQINSSVVGINEGAKGIVFFPDFEIELSVLPEGQESFSNWIIRQDGIETVTTELSIRIVPKEGTEVIVVNK